MLGFGTTVAALPATVTSPVPLGRPPPERRVVEHVAQARLQQQQTTGQQVRQPAAIRELSASARQFADVLESTGSVQVAVSISGFQAGSLDVYA